MSHTPKLEAIRKKNPNLLGSGRMVAIIECLMGIPLEDRSTKPAIQDICVTDDGAFLAMNVGDIGYNEFMGAKADLERNILGLAKHFGAEREGQYLLDQIKLGGVDS